MTKSSRRLCMGSRDDWLVSGKIFLSLRLEKRERNQRGRGL